MTDTVIFGNFQSESAHNFSGALTRVCEEGRRLLPTIPPSRFSGEATFTMKIDPVRQNYLSLKLISSERYTPIFLYLDGKQLGYAKCGDFEALNPSCGGFEPKGFFYTVTAVPLCYTTGKTEIELTLRQAEPYDDLHEVHGSLCEAYSLTSPVFEMCSGKKELTYRQPKNYTKSDIDMLCRSYIDSQVEFFGNSLAKLRRGEKLSITKYVEEFRHFCMMLFEPYCPLEDKREAVELILNCINSYVEDYFKDPKTLLHSTHQSDWGGYYAELGQGLYITERLIDKEYGREKFREYLASPFDAKRTKKEALEVCLKANFDFASSRQSYIYNQTYYTYEGAWKSMAGLGVIESRFYIGKEKCDLILKEALGLAPWKGEHILFDKSGRELDLYHCLFNHDRNARFTDDCINIVAKGEAVQGVDENGEFLRRKPYGENYFPLTHTSLSRENGYVGNYGETANYLPEWVYRTFNHGDFDLSDLILKTALENINSRMYMRYSGADEDGSPIMLMEQGIDERNPTLSPKPAYGAIINDKRTFGFASLKRHMEEHAERYSSPEWDKYKGYAVKALDALCQQHMDSKLEAVIENQTANYNDFRVDRTVRDIFSHKITSLLPHTDLSIHNYNTDLTSEDFVFFDIDNLLLSLRDGDTHIFAQLNHRSRGFNGYGRAHIIKHGTHCLTQFKTDGSFTFGGRFIRQQNVNMDYIYDSSGSNSFFRAPEPLREFGATPQALCGEEQSVTYQKGIGHVLRENYEVDTPYSGYPDVIWAKIDKYFIACNTTRKSYENEKVYTLPFKVNGEEITLEPFSYRVIKTEDRLDYPSSVKAVNALTHQDGVLLSWKEAEGESYNIYRDGVFLRNTKDTVLLDRETEKGVLYTYSVTSVNAHGESIASPSASARAEKCGGFIRAEIGSPSSSGVCFGSGNDYRARERDIRDSLYFYAKAVHGDMSAISPQSVTARESFLENARYAYIGFEGNKIVIRTRSKNTIYAPGCAVISPLCYEFDRGDFTLVKLIIDKDLHSAAFFAANDKGEVLLHREVLPLPSIYYIGSAHSDDVLLKPQRLCTPFPVKSAVFKDNALLIQKGLDNKYLCIESSADGKNFTVEKEELVSQTYSVSNMKPYYRITPVSRRGIRGGSIILNARNNKVFYGG